MWVICGVFIAPMEFQPFAPNRYGKKASSFWAAGLAAAAVPLAYLPDCFLDAASPGVAMPRKHVISGDRIQACQRFDRLGGVRGERRDLRAARPRGHRVGGKRVADEQRAERGDVQRGAA